MLKVETAWIVSETHGSEPSRDSSSDESSGPHSGRLVGIRSDISPPGDRGQRVLAGRLSPLSLPFSSAILLRVRLMSRSALACSWQQSVSGIAIRHLTQ